MSIWENNQIPLEGKKDLIENIKVIGGNRDVVHLYNNMTDGHGRWFEWKLEWLVFHILLGLYIYYTNTFSKVVSGGSSCRNIY